MQDHVLKWASKLIKCYLTIFGMIHSYFFAFREILMKNGTAVDIAIAVLVCNGAVHSHSLGLGGGLFMTIYIKS